MPPVQKKKIGDRPDGHDPRDQYVGHKRIDFPIVNAEKIYIDEVRFHCIRTLQREELNPTSTVYLRQFSLHKKQVPWE